MFVYHFTLYFDLIDCNACLRAFIFPLQVPLVFFCFPELCIQLGVFIVLQLEQAQRDSNPHSTA